jgi:hypothetical protein
MADILRSKVFYFLPAIVVVGYDADGFTEIVAQTAYGFTGNNIVLAVHRSFLFFVVGTRVLLHDIRH